MPQPLDGFVRALRAADVPVSVRETIEALLHPLANHLEFDSEAPAPPPSKPL